MGEPVHIIGAGVVGSTLMRVLQFHGADFTWSDNDSEVVAWKASTGSVCHEAKDPAGLFDTWRTFAERCLHPAEYEEVPHLEFKNGSWFQGHETSFHLDVQSFVLNSRAIYADRRVAAPPPGAMTVQTAGSMTALSFWWGWSVQIRAEMLRRCSYSARVVRQVRYLYPKPGSDLFYLGSSITFQRKPKELNIQKHIDWFNRDWKGVMPFGAGEGEYTIVTEPVHGWRPVGTPGRWEESREGNVVINPMSASGVKYSPFVAQQIVNRYWPWLIGA